MFNDIKTIIFDMDGTIYHDYDFHRSYIRNLLRGTDMLNWESSLINFADEVLGGKRLRMNSYYPKDMISRNDPESYFGALESSLAAEMSYTDAIASCRTLYLGDAWALVTLLGETLGLLKDGRGETVFLETREDMKNNGLKGNETLRRALIHVGRQYQTVLLSNTYREIAYPLLEHLGYSGVFGCIGFSASKPHGMLSSLEALCPGALSRPETILSIGDHAFNDLMPIEYLGGKTVWMSPYPNINEPAYCHKLRSIEELAEFLDGLCG